MREEVYFPFHLWILKWHQGPGDYLILVDNVQVFKHLICGMCFAPGVGPINLNDGAGPSLFTDVILIKGNGFPPRDEEMLLSL